jgi:peptide/nickel transport system permease protein
MSVALGRRWSGAWRGRASLVVGAALVATLIGVAALSLLWTPYPPAAIDIPHKLQTPSLAHWLGTDLLGRDIVSQLMAGARVSILVGVIAVAIGLIFGVLLGLIAAFAKGVIEDAMMRIADFTFAFPALLTAIMLTSTFGPGVVNAIVAIGIFNIPVFAKLARATANHVLAREFALAARVAGRGPIGIACDHVLPNIAPMIIVQASIQFATAILAEAALSYLGLGAQPPQASWGRMLSEAQALLYNAPRIAVFPGVAIALSVLGLNLLGDGLRDAFDPKLKSRT